MAPEPDSPLEFPEPENLTTKRRRRRGLWFFTGVIACLLATVLVLYFSPLLALRNIEVTGNDLLTDARANELTSELRGTPLPQVGTHEVREALGEENVVADVNVRAELPFTLHVEILEYPPVAEVHDGDDVVFYNELGEVIRVFSGAESLDAQDYATPQISSEAALEDQAVFAAIVAVLGELPEGARDQLDSATADSIDSVTLELSDGREVLWGSTERSVEKAAVLAAVLDSAEDEFSEAEVIDISTPSSPVIR